MLLLPLLLAPTLLAAPAFQPERGFHDEPFQLLLTPEQPDSEIFFTIGSTTPDAVSGTLYTEPITVDGTSIVRAVEIPAGGPASQVVTHSYLFIDDIISSSVMDTRITEDDYYGPLVAEALLAVPSISLVTPEGLDTTERTASVEWLDPQGDDFQIQAGLNECGGTSLSYDKVSYRLHFRSEYGYSRLEFPLYDDFATGVWPADDFDALTLRSGSHDTTFWLGTRGQYLRNRWIDETQLEMGHYVPHGRFVQLYINGVYDGHYHVREHYNGAFMAEYLGGDEDDYVTVNACSVTGGDSSTWNDAVAASTSFEDAVHWIDVENLIDYMLVNMYGANAWDWGTCQNWKAAGPTEPDRGGFRFQSHDSDIILCYSCSTDLTSHAGPGGIFGNLVSQRHPDFMMLLADRIHAHLFGDGVLTPEAAAERFDRLVQQIDLSIVAESARWGQDYWERDQDWYWEQDRLYTNFFPCRTDALIRQLRNAGFYELDAPDFEPGGGAVAMGTDLLISAPEGVEAQIWYSLDGQDPRLPGGAISDSAIGPHDQVLVELEYPTGVMARLKQGENWGALNQAWYEIDRDPPLILNEWNVVAQGEFLASMGTDSTFGRVEGNGGDWLELVVTQDLPDLRGFRLEMEDRNGSAGQLVLSQDPMWQNLEAGSIITVAEDIPGDFSYDPQADDWTIQVNSMDSTAFQQTSAFDITNLDWQLTIRDSQGNIRFGPVGEGVDPEHGISSREMGQLQQDPSPEIRRFQGYDDGYLSTFGAPNAWDGGEQDFSALRATEPVADSGMDPATGQSPADEPDTGPGAVRPISGTASSSGCASGCSAAGSHLALSTWLFLVLVLPCRRGSFKT